VAREETEMTNLERPKMAVEESIQERDVHMRSKWPLFWSLEPAAQAKLIQYQWDNYNENIAIPAPLEIPQEDWPIEMESLEEIDRLMRQKPRRPKGDLV